uniref:NADH-ubiquinone oxidoreductase chain 2 n=1 Tax=Cerambycidae sp. 6 KM-2017 TaxID=2219291 RepID=A0A346RGS3_9CUCU|nr:NADH dehydrogenase subunit 2 [Cerambycidae sp. 6 KM-2017]
MFKFYKIMFFSTMVMGTLIAISAYSWLAMWMGLEINLLSIIPLLNNNDNLYPSEASLKYFITQVLASSILLLSVILKLNLNEIFNYSSVLTLMLNSALLTKLGAAPFHAWFPEVMEGLNWSNSLLILTWQKIAPFIILMYAPLSLNFIIIIIIISTSLSGIMGINQTSLRKILAYSSINHISWMLASILNNQVIWSFYFIIYSIITINIILILKKTSCYFINQLNNSLNKYKMFNFFFILNFLSLGGLPPFLGFFPKWLVINNLIMNNLILLSLILIVITLITLFFYLRITFSVIMINSSELMIYKNQLIDFTIIVFNFISLSGLLACTLVFSFL